MNTFSSRKEEVLEAEVKRLKEELKKANLEKSEMNFEYEKLTTICRSQRQQLHGIKQALASDTTPGIQPQGWVNKSGSSPDQNSWQAFPEDFKASNSHQSRAGAAVSAARSPVAVPVTNFTSQAPGWTAF